MSTVDEATAACWTALESLTAEEATEVLAELRRRLPPAPGSRLEFEELQAHLVDARARAKVGYVSEDYVRGVELAISMHGAGKVQS